MVQLILLPGFMGCASDWDAFRAEIPHPASVLPSFGAPLPENEPFVLCGYSMGGRVAISRSLAPGCRGIICISSSPGLRDLTERGARRISDEKLAQELENVTTVVDFRQFLEKWWEQPIFANSTLTAPDWKRLLMSRLNRNPRELAADLRTFGPGVMPSLWEHWQNLTIPKLAVAGEKDAKYAGLAREMGAHFIVPGAGHQVPLEQPRLLAHAVTAFVQKNPGFQ